ncbi:restriction endonuclease subunit S [Endozoicomonas sp. ONNA1]|uniref:restriction endonuclease subunit S n=1 Tax=Endozoicomonas sp. ONNA1 TaxID=2828740 RepID=UPI00214929F7|nr:restriction endonuclease subunit S [Endozoicomonas sp. ONNA1]
MKIRQSAIQSICTVVTTGATNSLYETVETNDISPAYLLPGNALDLHGNVNISLLKPVKIKEIKRSPRFTVQEGDIVILAKGNAIRTAYITKEVAERNVIISANFVLLRPDRSVALGQAIVAYFNTPAGKNELEALNKGSVIKSISAADIRQLQIPVPSLDQQQQVAELFHTSLDTYQKALQLAEQEKRTALACINQLFQAEVIA